MSYSYDPPYPEHIKEPDDIITNCPACGGIITDNELACPFCGEEHDRGTR